MRIGRSCARRRCRALHPRGIKDDRPQRHGKDRKQDRLSHRATLHDGSRATTSDRRVATMKSGFRDSGSRLEPLLLDRVDVFPSFLPKQASTTPGSAPGLFLSGEVAPGIRSKQSRWRYWLRGFKWSECAARAPCRQPACGSAHPVCARSSARDSSPSED